jgi:DNA replication ATP-dependent helicase Dna2
MRNKTTPDVVGMTGSGAFGSMFRKLDRGLEEALGCRFDAIVFDEACQLTVPIALLSMMHSDRIIMAGDHKQLPPVVKTTPAGVGFGRSIFQMLVEETKLEPVLLDATWRLNDALLQFPSRHFYSGFLNATEQSSNRKLEVKCQGESGAILNPENPSQLVLIRHEGRGQESIEEAALVTQLVCDAINGGVPHNQIAVIASHRRQTVRIRTFLAARGRKQDEPVVDTVDRIQGRERDLIIISMTHSDEEDLMRGAEFLFLPNRFNVAITRARRKLIIVASPHFFRALPHPSQLRDRGDSVLRRMNVLKQWYFEHRAGAIDATDMTAEVLRELTAESNAPRDGAK